MWFQHIYVREPKGVTPFIHMPIHSVWFIRNTVKFDLVLFLNFSEKGPRPVAYLFLIFSKISSSLFLKNWKMKMPHLAQGWLPRRISHQSVNIPIGKFNIAKISFHHRYKKCFLNIFYHFLLPMFLSDFWPHCFLNFPCSLGLVS